MTLEAALKAQGEFTGKLSSTQALSEGHWWPVPSRLFSQWSGLLTFSCPCHNLPHYPVSEFTDTEVHVHAPQQWQT